MRSWILAGCAVAVLTVSPALAKGSDTMKACAADWKQMSATDKAKTTYKAYSASCLSGKSAAATETAPATAAAAAPTMTSAGSGNMKACAATWKGMAPADKAKTTYRAFSSTCLKGGSASAAPAAPATAMAPAAMAPARHASSAPTAQTGAMTGAPAGATGKCKDGTYTMAIHHSGACSHHGGVASWM